MNLRSRLISLAWIIIPICACGFLVWAGSVRMHRAEYVTGLVQGEFKADAASPTGYAGGVRELILPEHNEASYGWIAQTQQMLAQGDWRVRHIDYANAPYGHTVSKASAYRWWLGLVAWFDRQFSDRSVGRSVEQAALLADPLLHLLLLAGAAVFVTIRFGALSAALCSVGAVALFPFAGEFLPGLPDDRGLALACAVGSVMPLLAGIDRRLAPAKRRTWGLFFCAGVIGGLGMWVDLGMQTPILLGVALGGLLAAWIERDGAKHDPAASFGSPAWRAWGLGGAVATIGACVIEYFPAHMELSQLRAVHPLYGVAWLGGGELLALTTAWIRDGNKTLNRRVAAFALTAAALVAALPVVMWKTHSWGFLTTGLYSSRLTKLPGGAIAPDFWNWYLRDGITPAAWAAMVPVLLLLPAVWMLVLRNSGTAARIRLAIALGPVLVALGFAWYRLSWWSTLDAMLIVLVVASTAALAGGARSRFIRWSWCGFVLAVLAPGAARLVSSVEDETKQALSVAEVTELTDRELAHWLAKEAGPGGALILAPLTETSSLCFYGGLRGLGTLDWENNDGLVGAMRISSATTEKEARELMQRRGVTHIVIPSWDSQLDDYARAGLGKLEGSFIDRLHQWALPNWLRPVPYQFPVVEGLENRSVVILQTVEEQNDVGAMSRLTEYFVEMNQLDQAAGTAQLLRRYPVDIGALTARAQVDLARGDSDGFKQTIGLLLPRLSGVASRFLPWDRRASLAVVLARSGNVDKSKEQVRRCLADINEARMRSLTTGSLYRLLVLGKAFDIEIADPELRALALQMLPPELRSRL